jgi:hypothetical protein
MSASSEKQTYRANCHCGAVRFTVALSPSLEESEAPYSCNCSICTKNGYLLVYPLKEDVVFQCGTDNMSAYFFGAKTKPHRFCKTCGTSILIDFSESSIEHERSMIAVNVSPLPALIRLTCPTDLRAAQNLRRHRG